MTPEVRVVAHGRVRRSRDGCVRCKSRKIKCDETKPECLQCTRHRYACPGYAKTTKWSTKHERFRIANRDADNTASRVSQSHRIDAGEDIAYSHQPNEPAFTDTAKLAFGLEAMTPLTSSTPARNMPFRSFSTHQSMNTLDTSNRVSSADSSTIESFDVPALLVDVQQIAHATSHLDNLYPYNYAPTLSQQPEPKLVTPPFVYQPVHVPTMLIEYWFRKVCPILSAFDSQKNLFRVFAHSLWNDSSCVYHTMLSMSAACLNEQLPHLSSIRLAVQTRATARQSLREDIRRLISLSERNLSVNILMACFLLGSSASWIDDQDVGLEYFTMAQMVLNHGSRDTDNTSHPIAEGHRFFQEAFVYWEMLIRAAGAFDASQKEQYSPESSASALYAPGRALGLERLPTTSIVVPHPLTASATPALNLLARTLSLTRRQRLLQLNGNFSNQVDLERALENVRTAQTLERLLLWLRRPTDEDICDTEDEATPASHFVYLADSTRLVALLQLYKVFPTLASDVSTGLTSDTVKSTTSLALDIVDTIANIPPTSGLRCMIPILLIMVSDGLRFQPIVPKEHLPDMSDWFIPSQDLQVARARTFILDRLHYYERCLPARPVQQALRLVKEVWRRLENGEEVFWMETMLNSALTTVFC